MEIEGGKTPKLSKRNFSSIIKVTGSACNLDCDYCYYLDKAALYPKEKYLRMQPAVLEKYIKDFIEAQADNKAVFIWHGGEPTLAGLDYFKEIIRLQNQYADGRIIENVLQTNGTQINDEWCEFLVENKFLCGLSVDGTKTMHDRHRKTRSGAGTWDVVASCARLFIKHGVEFNTMTAVNADNAARPMEVYKAMKDLGSHYMQFLPVVEKVADDEKEPMSIVSADYGKDSSELLESVSGPAWGNFLCRIFDYWVKHDVGNYYVNIFDNTLAGYVDQPRSLCTMDKYCTCCPTVEKNGDVYLCDRLVFPQYKMGNIKDDSLAKMVVGGMQWMFETEKEHSLSEQCKNCQFLRLCNGDCPNNRYDIAPDGVPISSICKGYYDFFKHTQRHFEFMAREWLNGRAPANVMLQKF